jgi:hypothetical protein
MAPEKCQNTVNFHKILIFPPYPWYSPHPDPGSLTMRTIEKSRNPMSAMAGWSRTDQSSIAPSIAQCLIKSLGADEALHCARRHRWDGVLTAVLAESGHAGACR